LDQFGDERRPPGLVAGPEPGAIIAVEILIEQDMIAPMWVGLDVWVVPKDWSPAVRFFVA
jgi:hypothetical protein